MDSEQIASAGFTFLISDLELGLTLTQIAENSDNSRNKRARNQSNARRAYDAVQKFADRTVLTVAQRSELDEKATRLKSELEKLGEVF